MSITSTRAPILRRAEELAAFRRRDRRSDTHPVSAVLRSAIAVRRFASEHRTGPSTKTCRPPSPARSPSNAPCAWFGSQQAIAHQRIAVSISRPRPNTASPIFTARPLSDCIAEPFQPALEVGCSGLVELVEIASPRSRYANRRILWAMARATSRPPRRAFRRWYSVFEVAPLIVRNVRTSLVGRAPGAPIRRRDGRFLVNI